MSRSISLLAVLLVSVATPSLVAAQHALPIEALALDGLAVQSVRAPDAAELPVRVVLAREQAPRFQLDVWVAPTRDDARALLAARIDTLSTLGLSPRTGLGSAQAWATEVTGAAGLVALAIENVVIVVRAIDGSDAIPLAAHLAAAVLASAPPAPSVLAAPESVGDVLTIQEPAGAVDWVVTCDGACEARRTGHAFRIARTASGAVSIGVHVVDAFLRAGHAH